MRWKIFGPWRKRRKKEKEESIWITFGQLWDNFETTLRKLGDNFEKTWRHFETNLRQL